MKSIASGDLQRARNVFAEQPLPGAIIQDEAESRIARARQILDFQGSDAELIHAVFPDSPPPAFIAQFMASPRSSEPAELPQARADLEIRFRRARSEFKRAYADWVEISLRGGLPPSYHNAFDLLPGVLFGRKDQDGEPFVVTGSFENVPVFLNGHTWDMRTDDGLEKVVYRDVMAIRVQLPGGSRDDFVRDFGDWTSVPKKYGWQNSVRPGTRVALLYEGLVDGERTDVFSGTMLGGGNDRAVRIRDDSGKIWTPPHQEMLVEIRIADRT
jgi:hypothetical protein